ncbi:MAG: penicillin acylase family protein [Polyangiaceae bacterium]|nr:penicillin acylase family protein [Polyangiaceae bacterium]
MKPRRLAHPKTQALASLASLLAALTGCSSEDTLNPAAPAEKFPSEAVELVVDELGISHVFAKNDADAFYGAGYAMARDRLFHMELNRRQALGRKAEIFGASATKADIGARTMGFGRLGEADMKHLRETRPEDARLIDAWIAGVNRRIEEVRTGEAPRPYGLRPTELDFVPEDWKPEHAFAIGKVLGFGLSNSLDMDVLATALLRLAPATVESMPVALPAYDMYTMLQDTPAAKSSAKVMPPPVPQGIAPLPQGSLPPFSYEPFMREMGSNNWAVDGARSTTGKPWLCGDPHQALTSPTRLWPLHMNSADAGGSLDVIGFAFVGTPTVELGHNAHVAWAPTTNFADAMDLWDVPLTETATSVKLAGESHPIVTREEIIRVRAEGAPVGTGEDMSITVREVPGFGVILPDEILPVPRQVLADGYILFNWVGFQPTSEPSAYLALDRAKTLDEFDAAVDLIDVGAVNMVAASAEGIGYHVHASIPDRGVPSAHPMPWRVMSSKDPESFWTRGFLPPSSLPHERNPARGFIATANNEPWGFTNDGNVENDPFYYGTFFANGFRAQRIDEVLRERTKDGGKVSRADMEELQRDVKSLMAETVVPRLGEAMAAIGTDPALAAYVGRADLVALADRLVAWDYRFAREKSEPVIFLGLEWFAAKRAFEVHFTPLLFNAIVTKSPPAMIGFLRNVIAARFEGSEKFAPDGVNALLLGALDDTAAWLTASFGGIDAAYTLGDVHAAEFPTEFGGELEVGRIVVDGHVDTVNVSPAAFFGEDGSALKEFSSHEMSLFRIVVGFGEDGRAESTIDFARGTREDPSDPHFADQDESWSLAQHRPLPFRRSEVEASETERLTLPAQ